MRAIFIIICLIVGGVGAYYAQPFARGNADIVLVVTTVFTVFAGFLVAIIAILGDPSLVPGDDWKTVENRRNNIEGRIIWHIWLFVIYLVTLAVLFISVVLEKVPCAIVSDRVKDWIEFGYLFIGTFSFCLSFALPFALLRLQMQRLDEETERRRGRQRIP
jgi:hypothetical protein